MSQSAVSIIDRAGELDSLKFMSVSTRKLCSLLQDDNCPTTEIAKLISSDPILAARILKLINSAFYGFPHRISTITQAVVLLGTNVIKGLVLSASILEKMTQSMAGLFEHSLACSIACAMIARRIGLSDPEQAQIAGLLHDFGKVVLASEFKPEFNKVLALSREQNISFYEAEMIVFDQVSHCEIADCLFEKWKLPPRLRNSILYHHRPHRAGQYSDSAALVQLGDMLARVSGLGFGGDVWVPDVRNDWFREFDLDYKALDELLEEYHHSILNLDMDFLVEP